MITAFCNFAVCYFCVNSHYLYVRESNTGVTKEAAFSQMVCQTSEGDLWSESEECEEEGDTVALICSIGGD